MIFIVNQGYNNAFGAYDNVPRQTDRTNTQTHTQTHRIYLFIYIILFTSEFVTGTVTILETDYDNYVIWYTCFDQYGDVCQQISANVMYRDCVRNNIK